MANEHRRERLIATAAKWLYNRVKEERAVWAAENGTPMPDWDDVDATNKRYWHEHGEEMLVAIGVLEET